MEDNSRCRCCDTPALIFSCSGAADVGEISDRAGRRLSAEGVGKMYCLAGVGGHVEGIVKTTEAAKRILTIDGCPVDCARKSLEQAGIAGFNHMRVTDLGMEKGKSPATEERIAAVTEQGRALLAC